MGRVLYLLSAVVMIIGGGVLFGYMMRVSYGGTPEWDRKLIEIGMPLSFLLPVIGALLVSFGLAMLSHAWQQAHGGQ